jgi:tetratricopeptide (TPR) repeat protein
MSLHGKLFPVIITVCASAWLAHAQADPAREAQLWRHRNLAKALYENPITQVQAVAEFKAALDIAPGSVRERLNYALALLRAGELAAGIAELEKVQKQDPKLPHTWFNLGVAYKKADEFDKSLAEFEGMARLVPTEPVAHYQIGTLHKIKAEADPAIKPAEIAAAIQQFETARDLDPLLAAPHFQLYGLYRQTNHPADAATELRAFQEAKKRQDGAAIPEDMDWCMFAEIYDPIDAPPPAPLPAPVYRDQKLAAGFTGDEAGLAVLGLDGGSRPSLIAWGAGRAQLFRNGKTLVPDSGLEALRDVVSIVPGDFDNDGLPDLCVITKQGAALYRNVKGHFEKAADLAAGVFHTAVWLDYDHDYDLDLFLIGPQSKLFRNNGEAGFSDETARFPFVAGHARDAVRFDLEPDTPGFDLVVTYDDRPGVLYRDRLVGHFEAVPLDALPAGFRHLVARDVNRDGRTDLVVQGPLILNLENGLLLFNRAGKLEPQSNLPGDAFPPREVLADFEGNGRLDHALIDPNGALVIRHDVTPDYGNWIEVALTGEKNLKTGVNAKIEVKAGMSYEKVTYLGVPTVFRLGNLIKVDTVRITWPNGLVQNETNLAVNKVYSIKEAPRLAGSCPMIFTWNGSRFQFLTDVLGVAPLGASSGDGQFFPVDHQEYVSIPAEALQPRDGAYELRVTEELREVSYLDQIELMALDHPADTEIVTNEKFKSPPFPDFRLFGVKRKVYPVAAHDSRGTDVRAAILHRDSAYPDSFRRDVAGVAELHHLDLDFGGAARSNRAALILYGWVDWADGSTFLSATQAHRDLVFPYLQVKDAAGNWKTVVEDMGMPSGKPKPMAVELAGKFLSASREVRIVTNLCVYWDEIYLVEDDAPPEVRMTRLALADADLHFRGFSQASIDPQRKQPEEFHYDTVSYTSMWNPTPGLYTRYGPVQTLLAEPDDRMVVMGSGDELRMRFRATGLPPVPPGWKRDFLLLVDGWAKDGDANTAFSQSVLPLPFHAMTSYPYPPAEHFPTDAAHADFEREYLTRPALRLIRPLAPETAESQP